MSTLRTAAIGTIAAAAIAAGSAAAASGGAQMSTNSVHQSVSSTVVSSSGPGTSSSTVSISQSSGSGSVAAQAVATSPPGPTLAVRLPARRVKALLADRAPRLAGSADRAAAVDVTVTLRWRPRPGARGRVVLLRRELAVEADAPRRLRLGASEQGLDRLPDTGRITILITGRAAAGVAVGLQLTA